MHGYSILIGETMPIRGDTPVCLELGLIIEPELDMCIPYVENKQHLGMDPPLPVWLRVVPSTILRLTRDPEVAQAAILRLLKRKTIVHRLLYKPGPLEKMAHLVRMNGSFYMHLGKHALAALNLTQHPMHDKP